MRAIRKKQPTVTLVTADGQSQELEVQHAERLLDMGPNLNGGWKLAPNSKYTYDEENGLRVKADKRYTAEA